MATIANEIRRKVPPFDCSLSFTVIQTDADSKKNAQQAKKSGFAARTTLPASSCLLCPLTTQKYARFLSVPPTGAADLPRMKLTPDP